MQAVTAVKSLGSARAMELFKDLEEPRLFASDLLQLDPVLPSEGRTGEHVFWEEHWFEPGTANLGEYYLRIEFKHVLSFFFEGF